MQHMAIFGVPWPDYTGELAKALLKTIEFTLAGFAGSVVLGIIIALMRSSSTKPVRGVAGGYTEIFKNLPLITEIYIIYFGLASIGIRFDVFVAGTLALVLFYGAYMSEIFRGGLQGVDAGQREAARALGMTPRQVATHIVLPQAIRLALPGTGTMMVDLLKGTSLLVTIGGAELMTQGTIITSATFRPMEVYLVIGAIYFAMCFPLSRAVGRLERRLRRGAPLSLTRRNRLRLVDAIVAGRATAGEGYR